MSRSTGNQVSKQKRQTNGEEKKKEIEEPPVSQRGSETAGRLQV